MKIKLKKVGGKSYNIIYCDPPWRYSNANTGGSMVSGAGNKYPTMSMQELKLMGEEIKKISAENSTCFMWTTGVFLLSGEAIELMQEWGFIPKTIAFVWAKLNKGNGNPVNGLGFYTRSSVEYCLLGIRGRLERQSASVRQLIETEEPEIFRGKIRAHSEKPAEVRDRIVQLYGDVPRIELFSRHIVEGWDRKGNQLL